LTDSFFDKSPILKKYLSNGKLWELVDWISMLELLQLISNFKNKIFFMVKWILNILWIGWMSYGLLACAERTSIGSALVDDDISVFVSDTHTVFASTVILDTLASSNTGKVTVGALNDPRLGKITSQSYFEIGLGTEWQPEDGAEFDSLVLFLEYNYYYGDTTQNQTFSLHRLTQELELPEDETTFYTNSSLRYEANSWVTTEFTPRPRRGRPLKIRLPNQLGNELLELARLESEILTDAEQFSEYLRGFVLIPAASNTCMLGFTTITDTTQDRGIFMRLYAHKGLTEYEYNFPITKSSIQFNQIKYDKNQTNLANLNTQKQDLSESISNQEVYNAGGVALLTKVKLPYLSKAIEPNRYTKLLYAELVLRQIKNTYSSLHPLPNRLELYATNERNEVISQITDRDGAPLSANLVIDREFEIDTYYKFNLTDFVLNKILENKIQDNSFLITFPLAELQNSYQRIVFGGTRNRQFKLEFRTIYTRFN
jgi:hypothetical protein